MSENSTNRRGGYSGGKSAADVRPPQRTPSAHTGRHDPQSTTDLVRREVKAAVEEWFTDVSLDDLFAVKGWEK